MHKVAEFPAGKVSGKVERVANMFESPVLSKN